MKYETAYHEFFKLYKQLCVRQLKFQDTYDICWTIGEKIVFICSQRNK